MDCNFLATGLAVARRCTGMPIAASAGQTPQPPNPPQERTTMAFSFARQLLLGFGTAVLVLPAWAADGKAIYDKTCVACHAAGVANAPKFGDKAAWGPRVATGKDALVASVVKGKGAMPPKAGTTLKDDEIAAAVDYMLSGVK
jgi:cytochrome c5